MTLLRRIIASIGVFCLACLFVLILLALAAHLPSCVREYPGLPSVYPARPPVDEAEFTGGKT